MAGKGKTTKDTKTVFIGYVRYLIRFVVLRSSSVLLLMISLSIGSMIFQLFPTSTAQGTAAWLGLFIMLLPLVLLVRFMRFILLATKYYWKQFTPPYQEEGLEFQLPFTRDTTYIFESDVSDAILPLSITALSSILWWLPTSYVMRNIGVVSKNISNLKQQLDPAPKPPNDLVIAVDTSSNLLFGVSVIDTIGKFERPIITVLLAFFIIPLALFTILFLWNSQYLVEKMLRDKVDDGYRNLENLLSSDNRDVWPNVKEELKIAVKIIGYSIIIPYLLGLLVLMVYNLSQ